VNKKQLATTSLLCVLLLFISRSFVFGQELNYSNILGIPTPTNLETVITFWFQIGAFVAGLIAIISFAIAGIQLTLGGVNPSLQKDAKDRMINAAIGLFVSVAAVLILRTINPAFIDIVITEPDPVAGIFYTNGSKFTPAPQSESDNSNIPNGYNNLAYRCSVSGPAILVWIFPKNNFEGNNDNYEGVKVARKECNSQEPLPEGGSFRWEYETPGVYYCMGGCNETGTVCSGNMSFAQVTSAGIVEPFRGNISSVRVVNDTQNDVHYGVIFHSSQSSDQLGTCSNFLYSTDVNKKYECFNNIPASQSSIIFAWNHTLTTNSSGNTVSTSGQGIDFYSEPYGWAQGARAGKYQLNTQSIDTYWTGSSTSLQFDYTGVIRPPRYKQIYTNFNQRPGSVNIKGSYIVVFRSGSYCQIFLNSIYNFRTTQMYAMVGSAGNINILPIK
jgi:hypothetical protein